MADKTKKIRLPITIGVVDEVLSTPERRHESGFVTQEARTVLKHVPPGQPVELSADEADRLLAKFGPYVETVIVTEGEMPNLPAPVSPPVATARR